MTYKIIPRSDQFYCGYEFREEKEGGRLGFALLRVQADLDYLNDPDNPKIRRVEISGPSINLQSFGEATEFLAMLRRAIDLSEQLRTVYTWYLLLESLEDSQQTVTTPRLGPSESFVRAVCREAGVEGRLIGVNRGQQYITPLRTEGV